MAFLLKIRKILKKEGLFSYFLFKLSDAFTNHKHAVFHMDSPFSGNSYPFRFLRPLEYEISWSKKSLIYSMVK